MSITTINPQTIDNALSNDPAPAGSDHHESQLTVDAHMRDALAANFHDDQRTCVTQSPVVVADRTPPATSHVAPPIRRASLADPDLRNGQPPGDTHDPPAVAGQTPPATKEVASPNVSTPLADPLLALLADTLDDLERTRVANENRLRQLTRTGPDKDGQERGFGLDESEPTVAQAAAIVAALVKLEHDATLNLRRRMRQHPLGPWVKAQKGVGEKQAARLLAAIGDPYWNTLHDRPRTVSELWAFCGLHVIPASHFRLDAHGPDAGGEQNGHAGQRAAVVHTGLVGVAPKRQRGQQANWSTTAKTRAYLIAESCIKQLGTPYRAVYDAAREKHNEAIHAVECVRCGPSGKPAQPGSPLSAGHKHARAMRAVMKTVLKDLWREAKRVHDDSPRSAS